MNVPAAQIRQGPRTGLPWKTGMRVATGIIFFCALALILVLVFFVVQSRVTGGPPQVFGHQVYLVLSGSMTPAIPVGSAVIVKPVDPGTVSAGDIITYRSSDGGSLVTHRAVAVNTEGGLSFTTKGDANDVIDAVPVAANDLVGRVNMSVPYAGYVMDYVHTKQGILFLLIIPGLLIMGFEIRNLLRYAAELDREKSERDAAGAVSRLPDQG